MMSTNNNFKYLNIKNTTTQVSNNTRIRILNSEFLIPKKKISFVNS